MTNPDPDDDYVKPVPIYQDSRDMWKKTGNISLSFRDWLNFFAAIYQGHRMHRRGRH